MIAPGDAAWLPLLKAVGRRRPVTLGLHGIGPTSPVDDPHGMWRAPERFRADVRLLQRAGFRFVTISELAAAAVDGRPPPGHAALTFDDGMQDNHDVLLPMLQELGVPATVFVATGLVGAPNPWLPAARFMTEDELRAMHAGGVELGAHTVTHPDLSTLGYEACVHEMVTSREQLERIIDAPVTSFAYPFCRFGEAAVRAVRDVGFRVAVAGEGRGGWDLARLERTMLSGVHGSGTMVLKATGAYDRLFESTAGRVTRGATRPLRALMRPELRHRA